VFERECKSSNERDFLRSRDSREGARLLLLGRLVSPVKARNTWPTMGDVEAIGSVMDIIDELEVWVIEVLDRCDGILARRVFKGDLVTVSIYASFGLKMLGV